MPVRELRRKWGIRDIRTVKRMLELPPLNLILKHGAKSLISWQDVEQFEKHYVAQRFSGGRA